MARPRSQLMAVVSNNRRQTKIAGRVLRKVTAITGCDAAILIYFLIMKIWVWETERFPSFWWATWLLRVSRRASDSGGIHLCWAAHVDWRFAFGWLLWTTDTWYAFHCLQSFIVLSVRFSMRTPGDYRMFLRVRSYFSSLLESMPTLDLTSYPTLFISLSSIARLF